MHLRIQLLGPPNIFRDESVVELPGNRPQALLAYLIMAKKPLRREHLIDVFFDGPDDPQAALRWTLSKLRKAIGGEYILADRQEVSFNFASKHWLDVSEFEAGKTELYKGDFLEGLYLRDAIRFEDWLLVERQRLREKYQTGLEKQLADHKSRQEHAEVVIIVQELLKLDSLREDWHGELIHAYARLGKRALALELHEKFRQVMRKEWETDPAPETTALVEAIRSGQFEPQAPTTEIPVHEVQPRNPELAGSEPEKEPAPAALLPAMQQPSRPFSIRWVVAAVAVMVLLGTGWALNLTSLFPVSGRSSSLNENDNGQLSAAPQELAGKTVTIMGAFQDEYFRLFQESMTPFEQMSGIKVVLVTANEDFELDLENRLETGDVPDVIVIPQPGWLAKLARQGEIVDLTTFMDKEYLYQQYPETYFELVTVDDQILGVWHTIDIKSLVWYPKPAFEAKGYEVPETWDELMALTDQIAADGGVPWCIGLESAEFTGWVGTDWIEDILLRTASPEAYDAWLRHELPFNSPEIRLAFEIMGKIWLNDAYVYGGTANIPVENVFDSPDHLFDDPPGCFLHKQASFAPAFFPPGMVQGQDYDFFYLPPIDPKFGKPVLGSGNLFVMAEDRPEVREVIRYLTTAEATKAFIENGGFLSPHKDTPLDWFPSPAELRFAQIIVGADSYRFDASDLMPDQVGLRSFYQGIVDWVNGADLDTVLQEIDSSWPK